MCKWIKGEIDEKEKNIQKSADAYLGFSGNMVNGGSGLG